MDVCSSDLQTPERRLIFGRGDDEDLPDAREHQHGDGIVDHRLVVDREQLDRKSVV